MKALRPPILLVLVLAVASPALAEHDGHIALGAGNTVYQLRNGLYDELFPEGTEADADSPVLAVDVALSDGTHQRWLVPGTASADAEESEILVYELESDQLYLFWQRVVNGIHPKLYLTRFDGAQWDEPIEFGGSPFARKESLQVVISRHSRASLPPEGGSASAALTVLHVFWSEARADVSAKRYAPIVITDEGYLGWTPVYDVDLLIPSAAEPPASPISLGIADAVRAQPGANRQACALGFLDPGTHQLRTYEIELVAPEIPALADMIRMEIIGTGLTAESRLAFASDIADRVVEWGAGFHDATVFYLAETVRWRIETAEEELTEEDLPVLGDKIRMEIIGTGMRIDRGGLAEPADPVILEIAAPWNDDPGHVLKVSSVSDREAPEVGGEAELWLSDSGRDVLVTWEEGERVYYRESVGDGWSEASFLEVGADLTREQIYQTLAERVRSR